MIDENDIYIQVISQKWTAVIWDASKTIFPIAQTITHIAKYMHEKYMRSTWEVHEKYIKRTWEENIEISSMLDSADMCSTLHAVCATQQICAAPTCSMRDSTDMSSPYMQYARLNRYVQPPTCSMRYSTVSIYSY